VNLLETDQIDVNSCSKLTVSIYINEQVFLAHITTMNYNDGVKQCHGQHSRPTKYPIIIPINIHSELKYRFESLTILSNRPNRKHDTTFFVPT